MPSCSGSQRFRCKTVYGCESGKTYGIILPVCSGSGKEAITDAALDMEKKILTVSVYLSETESEVLGELSVSIKDCWKKDRPK